MSAIRQLAKLAAVIAAGACFSIGLAQERLEPILAQMAGYEYGKSPELLFQLTTLIQDSMGARAETRRIEARLDRFLQSDATVAGKQAVCQQLSLLATDSSVPVLTAMLARPETAEMARYALARIPGPKAGEALRKALDGASGSAKIGIVNSLGERRDANAVPVLRSLLSSADSGIAQAAIHALGDMGSRPALEALDSGMEKVSAPLRLAILEAYLACAGRLARGGNPKEALTAYRRLLEVETPATIRVAALIGLAGVEGKDALPALSDGMASKDPQVRDAAIRLATRIPGRESTAALMDRFDGFPAAAQVRLLAALAEHGDAAARPLVTRAAASDSVTVRVAALAALGKLGDESSLGVLAERAASGQAMEQAAARRSLYELAGPAIDSAIVAAIGSSSGKAKVELILAAGERGATSSADALIQAAREPDPDVRRNALRALRNVAGQGQVPALIEMVTKAGTGDPRDATQALAAALKRSAPARMNQVISAYQAASTLQPRLALMDAMGQVSNPAALPLLRDALRDASPEIVRGAILALTAWADPAPLPDLIAAAKTNADPALQVLSVRGCLKLIRAPSGRPASESAKLLAGVMPLATQPAEKKAILALLPLYPCEEALRVAQDSLGDPTVAGEAKASLERIRNGLKTKP